MSSKHLNVKASASVPATDADEEPSFPPYGGPPFFSYGFRPFFLSASLFAGFAVPFWVLLFAGTGSVSFLYPPRDWHVHEMLFGFLPAVIAGFLLTAVPNWTGRAPLRGVPLLALWLLWLAGRFCLAVPTASPLVVAVLDTAFLIVLALLLWRELYAASAWAQTPIAVVISLYAAANALFHAAALRGLPTALPERLVLALVLLLLTLIGGRITPNLTREFLAQSGATTLPSEFSRFDVLSILSVVIAAAMWIAKPDSPIAGWAFVTAGLLNLARLRRWRSGAVRKEPLALILHIGYGWLVFSLFVLGSTLLGTGVPQANALHALTTGAVGAMTLAVMTRASLGHTGRPKRAGTLTVAIYLLVNLGAVLRILVPQAESPTTLTYMVLHLSAVAWSGAYLLFALGYGPMLVRRSMDEP
ncbi:MAG: conserved membrane protein of unknown function [Nitrospira sp.]